MLNNISMNQAPIKKRVEFDHLFVVEQFLKRFRFWISRCAKKAQKTAERVEQEWNRGVALFRCWIGSASGFVWVLPCQTYPKEDF